MFDVALRELQGCARFLFSCEVFEGDEVAAPYADIVLAKDWGGQLIRATAAFHHVSDWFAEYLNRSGNRGAGYPIDFSVGFGARFEEALIGAG
jgi:hypothetical protein